MFRLNTYLFLGTLVTGLIFSTGCADSGSTKYSAREDAMKVSVKASSKKILVNETVTFQSHTQNTLGHDAVLRWTTTGGRLVTDMEGRVARVTFETPGRYTVTSVLESNGREVDRESNDVEVAALP